MKSSKENQSVLDWIFASISMLGLIAFTGVVMWFVREPDLIIVTVVVLGIGVLYILRELRAGARHRENTLPSDEPDS